MTRKTMRWTDVRWNPLAGCSLIIGMRARGFVPSAGAGASLVAAGLVCLAVLSAMLGFDRWPGTAKGDDEGTLALRIPAAKAAGAGAGAAAAGPRPAPVSVSAAAPRAGATRRRATGSRPARRAAPFQGS